MHPTRGLIPPNDFIPIFESNGFISRLDFYVWDKVCQLLRKWIDHGKNPPPISVNVSRVNIYNKQFLSYMSYIIKKYDLPTYMLELELTESAYTDNPDLLLNIIKELKSLGFKIHMDDFGSGYSSLNILKDLPIDVIKIDLKFLESCDHIGRAENIIAAVVRMANWLRLPVIAEGVETKLQSDMLRSIGCSYAQGFYFAKPMPVEEYEKLIFITDNVESKSLLSVPDKQILDKIWEIDNNVNHMFNNILCGIAIYELFGDNIEIIRANDKYFEIVDNERTSTFNFNNRSIENYVHKDDLILIKKAFSHAIEFKSPIEFVYRHLNKNIGYKWIKLVINHITESGDRHLLYGSIYDITEFKITEEISKKEMVKCKLSLKELQIAIKNIDINIWEYDIINDYIIYTDSLDDNYSKIIKNAVDYFIKNGIIHKSCIDEFKQMYERLKSGEKYVFAYLIIKDIKTEIFCKKFIKYTNTYDNSGKPIKAYGFSSTLCE